MDEQYLWDRTGEPDVEIRRLENLLAPYKDRGVRPARRNYWVPIAIAATVSIAAILFVHRPASAWKLVMNGGQARPIAEGQIVETSATGGATLHAPSIGELKLGSNSRLKFEGAQLSLMRGKMHALIWAPPSKFVVETPSATTIDLGCEYTLQVRDDGSGLLTVNMGWVAFQAGSTESFIPAGAACRTRPGSGPGLPYFEDAAERFQSGAAAFDGSSGKAGLADMLASARQRDALTLWHLLLRTRSHDRELVAVRFAGLVPGTSAAALQTGDPAALDAAWNALGLGGTEWWRTWKRKW